MTTPTNDRQTSERERLHGVLSQIAEIEQLKAEIAALRAENEALRTVSPDDVRKMTEIFAFRIDCAGSPEVRERAMFAALQSFIRSKESRLG